MNRGINTGDGDNRHRANPDQERTQWLEVMEPERYLPQVIIAIYIILELQIILVSMNCSERLYTSVFSEDVPSYMLATHMSCLEILFSCMNNYIWLLSLFDIFMFYVNFYTISYTFID